MRVSQIGMIPSTAATKRAVTVATPDRRCTKFRAVRSAVSTALVVRQAGHYLSRGKWGTIVQPGPIIHSHTAVVESVAVGRHAAEHTRLLCQQGDGAAVPDRHQSTGREVALTDIFGQCGGNRAPEGVIHE